MEIKRIMALDKALQCLDEFPPDEVQALEHFEMALCEDPNNALVFGHFGEFLCNASDGRLRNIDRAIGYLKKCVELDPQKFPECYFYLAQCLACNSQNALEAEKLYRLGIELLEKEMDSFIPEPSRLQYCKEKIALAYCSIAELYLTDLCFQENAQQCVEKSFRKALCFFPQSFDAYSGLTCYYTTVGETETALEFAEKALKVLEEGVESLRNPLSSSTISLPQWNSQIQFASTLIDLKQTEWSKYVLDVILEQDERNVEIWRLYALHYLASGDPEKARDCVENGQQLLQELVESHIYQDDSTGKDFVNFWTTTLNNLNESVRQCLQPSNPCGIAQ